MGRKRKACCIFVAIGLAALAVPEATLAQSIVRKGDSSSTPAPRSARAPGDSLLPPSRELAMGVVRRLDKFEADDAAERSAAHLRLSAPERDVIVCMAGCNGSAGEVVHRNSQLPR